MSAIKFRCPGHLLWIPLVTKRCIGCTNLTNLCNPPPSDEVHMSTRLKSDMRQNTGLDRSQVTVHFRLHLRSSLSSLTFA